MMWAWKATMTMANVARCDVVKEGNLAIRVLHGLFVVISKHFQTTSLSSFNTYRM